MMRASHKQKGFVAAMLHRLSGIVVALAVHMALGLRVLAVEFFDFREKTLVPLSACVAAVFAVGLLFILNLG